MDSTRSQKPDDCREGEEGVCRGCPQEHACREVWSRSNEGPLNSMGLIAASVLVFLLPIITAIAGAAAAGELKGADGSITGWQMAGAAAGLAVGIAGAKSAMRLVKKHFYAKRES